MDTDNAENGLKNEIIEGRNAVIEALRAGRTIDKIYIAAGDTDKTLGHIASKAKALGIVVVDADRRKLDFMSVTKAHQGVVAVCAVREYASVDDILAAAGEKNEAPFVIVCDEVSDPHNMELSEDDIVTGLKAGVKDCSVVPVFCGCALTGVGTEVLLRAIADYVPDPSEVEGIKVDGPTVGYVFKTISDQFGKYSFVKVLSGKISADMSLRNMRARSTDKLGRLYIMAAPAVTSLTALALTTWALPDTSSSSLPAEQARVWPLVMKELLQKLREAAIEAIDRADDVDALEALRVRYLGKKGELTAILKQMGQLSAEERPAMEDATRQFTAIDSKIEMKEILSSVYNSLKEKGYNPINQLVGYILSEDPTYITNYNNARSLICRIDRDELLQELLISYLSR